MLNKFAAPIDYLIIGHLAADLQPDGSISLGGTASYASKTAEALGLRPGILTSFSPDLPTGAIANLPIAGIEAERSTTFENLHSAGGRVQFVHHVAPRLHPYMLPEVWRNPAIVHFAPLLDEIDLDLIRLFPASFIGLTPQGWLRGLKAGNQVYPVDWLESNFILGQADAAVLSIEDVGFNETLVEKLALESRILVVTEGPEGCRLFVNGFSTRIPAPAMEEVETTGAGDIFAAAFFSSLYRTEDPEKAARIAVQLASLSVQRKFLDSIPTEAEIYETALDEQRSEFARYSP